MTDVIKLTDADMQVLSSLNGVDIAYVVTDPSGTPDFGVASIFLLRCMWTFDDAAARDTAIPSPLNGTTVWIEDPGAICVYRTATSSWAVIPAFST